MSAATTMINLSGPARVRIKWRMDIRDDDNPDRPDERDDGFWPSRDREAAGWVGPVSDERFNELHEIAQMRMRAWENGDWRYVGVVAVAIIHVPCGADSGGRTCYVIHTMESAGLWGIESDSGESDSGESYLKEVFEQERESLLEAIKAMGAALSSGDFVQEGP